MKLELSLLCLLAAAGLSAAEPVFDAPTGLTLQAREGGRYQLLWDPIYRNDLLGYSVWLRRPGEREFTRLSVPVKVGKEVRKMPVTGDARLVLALGAARKDVEVSVVAEYEDGVSERAPSAFTRLAPRPAAPVVAAAGLSPAAKAEAAPVAAPGPEAATDPDESQSFNRPLTARQTGLIAPFGRWRSELGLEWDFRRSIRKGRDPFWTLGLLVPYDDWDRVVSWEIVESRSILRVPVTLRFGLMPGFEVWAAASYNAEDVYTGSYVVDGYAYDWLVPVRWVDDRYVELAKPSSSGFGDSKAGVRILPFGSLPLLLEVTAHLPTGQSRFRSFLDWDRGRGSKAGTGDGVQRMEFSAHWGRRGVDRGLSYRGSYSPGVVERVSTPWFFGFELPFELDHTLHHGDRFELGGAFTLPWRVRGLSGALSPGLAFRSLAPARWVLSGEEIYPYMNPQEQARLVSHLQERFVRDDQLEISLEAYQDMPQGVRAGGKLAYVLGVQGDALRLSGQFYY